MNKKILKWFGKGDVGASSTAMALAASGVEPDDNSHPLDAGDFNRCLLLIESVPEIKKHFHKVAKLSKEWRALIGRWEEVEKCFLEEVGRNWCKAKSAPKTYALMKEIGC